MRTGILINARLGSTRLKRKHFLDVDGKQILSYLLERIVSAFNREILSGNVVPVIATSDEEENRDFEKFNHLGCRVFYGSLSNIPLRHLQTARFLSLDHVISIDGDDILCAVSGMRALYDALRGGVAYARTSGLPFGMNCLGYSRIFLEKSLASHEGDQLETGWGRVFDPAEQSEIKITPSEYGNELRFTLDYAEDYEFFKAVISCFGDVAGASDREIIDTVIQKKLYTLNERIAAEYWDNFARNIKREEAASNYGDGTQLYKKARTLIPGGTQLLSKRPEMFLPEQWPSYYSRAKGAEVWGIDGRKYIDMSINGVGACILGFADPDVDSAVRDAIAKGSMATLNCPEEVELAELLCELHPWAEMVRYARCGGEAMALAVRVARASAGRDKVAFCGYHGWHDWYISANLADDESLDGHLLPGLDPAGIPRSLTGTAIPFAYNNTAQLDEICKIHGHQIAAIVMEPVRHSEPEPGFLDHVRKTADRIGAVLIFDEVTSGWRMNAGGIHLLHSVVPDIAVFAKGISNGYPMAAVIGKREVMEAAQSTFISSTYWTERIGPVAALASIRKFIRCDVASHLCRTGKSVREIWAENARERGLNVHIHGIPPLSGFAFDYGSLSQAVHTLFTQLMLDKGFLASKAFYATYSHNPGHLEKYASAVADSFQAIAQAIGQGQPEKLLRGPVAHSGFKRLA